MSLPYSDKEICKIYQEKPGPNQLQVLCDLNDCHRSVIINILTSYGIKVRKAEEEPVYADEKKLDELRKRRAELEFKALSFPEKSKKYSEELVSVRKRIEKYV